MQYKEIIWPAYESTHVSGIWLYSTMTFLLWIGWADITETA